VVRGVESCREEARRESFIDGLTKAIDKLRISQEEEPSPSQEPHSSLGAVPGTVGGIPRSPSPLSAPPPSTTPKPSPADQDPNGPREKTEDAPEQPCWEPEWLPYFEERQRRRSLEEGGWEYVTMDLDPRGNELGGNDDSVPATQGK
jgi:hypothetical protein